MTKLKSRPQPNLALLALLAGSVAAAGCSSTGGGSKTTIRLERHMDFFSRETKQPAVIDPQMFTQAAGTAAGTGPQGVAHSAGFAPVREDAPPTTPLFGPDGTDLHVTLGAWEAATGSVTLTCKSGTDTAKASLDHLIPSGVYSLFVVHLDATTNAARFTPFGTTNTGNVASNGHLQITSRTGPCLDTHEAVLVVWHSDGVAHGASPGTIGATQHNALIAAVPARH
ncbi:MAG: hypothetical protein NVS3B12_04780 [Acidimicrobiales bacterium]